LLWLGSRPWVFANQGKFTETIVKQSVKGDEEFNDWDWLDGKFNFRVSKVTLWHDRNTVSGVQFHYELDGTTKSPGKHCGENNNLKSEVLTLDEGEYVTVILVKQGQWLNYLHIQTNKGKSISGGSNNGETFVARVPDGNQFVCAFGEFANSFRKLGFYFDEIY